MSPELETVLRYLDTLAQVEASGDPRYVFKRAADEIRDMATAVELADELVGDWDTGMGYDEASVYRQHRDAMRSKRGTE